MMFDLAFNNTEYLFLYQAFIKTAATIYKKIQDGVFDVSNEVSFYVSPYLAVYVLIHLVVNIIRKDVEIYVGCHECHVFN